MNTSAKEQEQSVTWIGQCLTVIDVLLATRQAFLALLAIERERPLTIAEYQQKQTLRRECVRLRRTLDRLEAVHLRVAAPLPEREPNKHSAML